MVSEGFGVPSAQLTKREDMVQAIKDLLAVDGPFVLEVKVEKEGNIFPMVPAGGTVSEMRLD
jgi:acetolactate synthase-1/2/3 large subunit